jgi:hypothetical protein
MKYKTVISDVMNVEKTHIVIDFLDNTFQSFPAEVGNPNYDQFLEANKLTDKQVYALKNDVWYEL